MLISRIEQIQDYTELVKEVQDIVEKVDFKIDQIICQGRESDAEDWHLGTGRIDELEHKDEDSYINVFPSLSGTIIEKYIKKYNGYRTRILQVRQRHCYSVHRDPTPRIHIPIVTNRDCWMVWPFDKEAQRLPPGFAYWTDTTKFHSFMNGGTASRIHIVMCVADTDPNALIARL
jgi:hypothetical protein